MKKNKIKIYQCFLSHRIFFIMTSTIFLMDTILDIKDFFTTVGIVGFILWCSFFILGLFVPFSSFICVDKGKKILVFRRIIGKKVVISLDRIKRLFLNIDSIDEKIFTIDVVCTDKIIRFDDWSNPCKDTFSYSLFKVALSHQRKRLQKFIDQCNEYLETNQRKIASENKEDSNSENE